MALVLVYIQLHALVTFLISGFLGFKIFTDYKIQGVSKKLFTFHFCKGLIIQYGFRALSNFVFHLLQQVFYSFQDFQNIARSIVTYAWPNPLLTFRISAQSQQPLETVMVILTLMTYFLLLLFFSSQIPGCPLSIILVDLPHFNISPPCC